VAIKVNYYDTMERMRGRHAEDPLKEIAAMQLIGTRHPHVLGCDEVLFDGQDLNVVMRYCDRGDLFQLLQESQAQEVPGMTEARARYWFRQFVSGLEFLHRKAGICHRDLSPENLMIDDGGCLIIDMGMCLRVPYLDRDGGRADVARGVRRCLFKPQGACGKLPYMAPEIFANRAAWDGEAIDVFSSGTILFCMLTGNRSYQQPHSTDPQFYWMTRGLPQLLSDWGIGLSHEGLSLLRGMLTVNPRDRLTLDEVVKHPWFSYPDDPA
jgi:serine/threonine protein kinase